MTDEEQGCCFDFISVMNVSLGAYMYYQSDGKHRG